MKGSGKDDVRLGRLYSDLDRFTSGAEITVGMDPFDKDASAFMARTHPVQDGIFDIRHQDPRPAIRVFGAFCERDVFLGLTWRWRKELGGRKERAFDFAIGEARRKWDELFEDRKPLTGDNTGDYLSDKFLAV